MKEHSKFLFEYKIRLGRWFSLIFFMLLLLNACRQKERISIVWEERRARALMISANDDAKAGEWQVRLKDHTEAMLGRFEKEEEGTLFVPVVPFTAGAVYEVFSGSKRIGSIQIPLSDASMKTSLPNIYPGADTVPENLLKMYLQFSAPMREGEALQYIHLLDENRDTMPAVFLDLQPELWNKERTALTLWLDPGRIKRDLIPNRKMGNPLQKGRWYTMVVSEQWKDVQGIPLAERTEKKFFVGERDSVSPKPQSWTIESPKAGTLTPLKINLGEPLDFFLLGETINIVNEKNGTVSGEIKISQEESIVSFIPDRPWRKESYRIRVASHLEDLAGNNLNRPFDRDIQIQKTGTEKNTFERTFFVKE